MAGNWFHSLHKNWRAFVSRHYKPGVALVVVVYNMPEQAKKTLYSLTSQYQQGAREADDGVIVIENQSAANLLADFIKSLAPQLMRFTRTSSQESEPQTAQASAGEYLRSVPWIS